MIRMISRTLFAITLLAVASSVMAHPPLRPGSPPLVVVELFQSQGCSSCPPAEANLNAIAGDADVLALSYGVTYWDDLGWKDTFASQVFTDRQWSYAHHHGRQQVWTPQVYVDGQTDLVGSDRAALDKAVAAANTAGPDLTWRDGRLTVAAGNAPATCDVWLVRYDPRTIDVAIGAGENAGRTLPHRNVVRELVHLGSWRGAARSFDVPAPSMPGLSTAALIQVADGGAILSASRQHVTR